MDSGPLGVCWSHNQFLDFSVVTVKRPVSFVIAVIDDERTNRQNGVSKTSAIPPFLLGELSLCQSILQEFYIFHGLCYMQFHTHLSHPRTDINVNHLHTTTHIH